MEIDLFMKLLEDDLINFNAILIKNYKKLNIEEKDIIVLSMLNRQEMKGNRAFVPSKLVKKTGLSSDDFYKSLDNLTNKGYILIKVEINGKTQKEGEFFYLDKLYNNIVSLYTKSVKETEEKKSRTLEEKIVDLYEKEFKTQMSPLDAETIQKWAQERAFTYEEIEKEMLNACKNGKTSLKYVDSKLIKGKILKEQNPEYKETSEVMAGLKEKWKK
ncbi:MAG: DnaD domain protein [Bacillales bacterium]|nr:DnaD domain protein [Bacillales bacterium]